MRKEKVLVVLLNINNEYSDDEIKYQILELSELVRASGGEVVFEVIQNASKVNPKYFIGSGKAQEIKEISDNHEVDTIVFNHELTGSQIKNLESTIERKIVDRTGLILDIFATRAKTKESKLQVKLAQLEYRLPRLVGFRNYLSREGAGIGTRGPGEQKLEMDRRSIQREISSIKNRLETEFQIRNTKRKRRINSNIKVCSLIGYSNSGKSTILNGISNIYGSNNKSVYADDLLFATLETSTRNILLDNGKDVIISDTVGFVSNLPTKLIESFKSTLEEISDSDLLIIVMDISNDNYDLQLEATTDILKDLNISDKDILYVFNKMDMNPDFRHYHNFENEIYISAKKSDDIVRLVNYIQSLLFKEYDYYKVNIPYSEYDNIKHAISSELKDKQEFNEIGVTTYLYIPRKDVIKYSKYMVD
ncbi:GTPase HflX [Helcococcus sueciensis]|uniref:GTPase HflX n=1 Tax=Helcococcus sueciensis TaxID=241555 RepID=UPI0003FF4D6B|nr:GTPase HflX [Helcococcus sueciensis]